MKSGSMLAGREDNNQRNWSCLCNDMLQLIVFQLFPNDTKSFHLVCKSWSRIPPRSEVPPIHFPVPAQSQWLMCIKAFDGTRAKFFHPIYKYPYVKKKIPKLSGATLRFSNNGWLLMTRGKHCIFFFNPFTNDVIDLPMYQENTRFEFMAFTSSPTSTDCMVIGYYNSIESKYSIFTILRGEQRWEKITGSYDNEIKLSGLSPVLHDGKFYILGVDGKLGVLCHEDRNNLNWKVYENPKSPCDHSFKNFLVECDGDLFSVFLEKMYHWIEIFKLNDATKTWETVESLGEHMFFLGLKTSFARKKAIEGMQGKIYLPLIHENSVVYYSLDKERYETFGNNYSSEDLHGTDEHLFYSWIEPNSNACSKQELNWLNCS